MSKIVAILPTRNSAWVLGLSVRALLMWVDEVAILNHASTDGTCDIIRDLRREYPDRVQYRAIADPVWREMAHRQYLLEVARTQGATHIVTIDDDEVLTGNLLQTSRDMVLTTPPGRILTLPWLQLRGGIDQVIVSGMWAEQNASCGFVDSPELHWKVQAGGYDHHHRHPMGQPYIPWQGRCWGRKSGAMHLQMACRVRLLWKHILYALTERKRWPERTVAQVDAMYTRTVNECAAATVAPVPAEWWEPYQHLMKHLDIHAEPWQKAEALRMLAENPRLADGLTTYGLL